MIIVGCDYHPSFQEIAYVDTESGELNEQSLEHREAAEAFYRKLWRAEERRCAWGWRPVDTRVGSNACLAELEIELWLGDVAVIRAKRGRRKPKTDRQNAQHILHLMLKEDFPKIWVPSWENRDLRQLLWHRHRMGQARTRLLNQLQAVALNEGLRCKKKLWREKGRKQLEAVRLAP